MRLAKSGRGFGFIGLKFEEAGLMLDDSTVTFCSRMDLFIKTVVAQTGLQGLSEALEGDSGGSQTHNLTRGKRIESNFVPCPLVVRCYFVLVFIEAHQLNIEYRIHQMLLKYIRVRCPLITPIYAVASKANAFELTLLIVVPCKICKLL